MTIWIVGFVLHVVMVLIFNARSAPKDQWPPLSVIFWVGWPVFWTLIIIAGVVALVIGDTSFDDSRGP